MASAFSQFPIEEVVSERIDTEHEHALDVLTADADRETNECSVDMRMVDIADQLPDETNVERVLSDLEEWDLAAEGGNHVERETNDDGDEVMVTYRMFSADKRGVLADKQIKAPGTAESGTGTVEPTVTPVKERDSVLNPVTENWDSVCSDAQAMLDATEHVAIVRENVDAGKKDDGEYAVVVTLTQDGQTEEIRFTPTEWVEWPSLGFKRGYRAAFSDYPGLSNFEIGYLQARWTEQAEETEHAEEDTTADETEQELSKGERVDQYLEAEYDGDESVREIADAVDVSTGTVHTAMQRFDESVADVD